MQGKFNNIDNDDIYHIKRWGSGYFDVNEKGHLCAIPNREEGTPSIDIIKLSMRSMKKIFTYQSLFDSMIF